MRALAVAGLLSLLAGCVSEGPPNPDFMLAQGAWNAEGRLQVEVGLYDDDWRSADCDCRMAIQVGGTEVGTWQVSKGDFGPGDDGKGHVWRATVQPDRVEPCGDYEPFTSLSATADLGDRMLDGGWMLACKPA